uniref:Uncharacterized protein n=1 Tax=Cacopsylla melanoneura TaxID=428564 RepID=A0A8D8TG40_9HEMI
MIFLLLNIRVGGYTSVLATLYRRNTISDDLEFIFLIYKIRKIMRNPKHFRAEKLTRWIFFFSTENRFFFLVIILGNEKHLFIPPLFIHHCFFKHSIFNYL